MHGTIEDYKDITDKYLKKEITFDEYKALFNEKYNSFVPKQITEITLVNKHIISNT